MAEWWTEQASALIGAIGGSMVGVLGGVFGTVVGYCAPRGIARGPVLLGQAVVAGLGAVALVAGLYAALLAGQPAHVFIPLLLGGFLAMTVFGALLPVVRARYRQAEARRMDAEDLRRA